MAIDFSPPSWSAYPSASPDCEHDRYREYLVEANDIWGFEVDYYVLNLTNPTSAADPIYGENTNEVFSPAVRTKVRQDPPIEEKLGDIFGIINSEIIQHATMPKDVFQRDVNPNSEPKVGDVIHFPWNSLTYQLTNVDGSENIFRAREDLWVFNLKHYKFTNADAEVGDVNIDLITDSPSLSSWGDNTFIETLSENIDNYSDLPDLESVYGFE